jgi:uncharacterized protein
MEQLPAFAGVCLQDVNTRGNFDERPLHVAATRGDVEAAQILIAAGAELNARGEHGYTPLHEAIEQEAVDIVRLLVRSGARLDICDDQRMTALEFAQSLGNESVLAALTGTASET